MPEEMLPQTLEGMCLYIVCMYVYVCVCMYVCMPEEILPHTYVHTGCHSNIHTPIHTCRNEGFSLMYIFKCAYWLP